jgi:hypothetical protein
LLETELPYVVWAKGWDGMVEGIHDFLDAPDSMNADLSAAG